MSKQHCRMLQVERFFLQSRMLLRQSRTLRRNCYHFYRFWQQCCRFGNNVERKLKQIEHAQFVSTLLKGWNKLVRHCCPFGNKAECCLDSVAGVDGALDSRRYMAQACVYLHHHCVYTDFGGFDKFGEQTENAVSQWPSGNMPDCGVRGSRFESHRGRLCLSRQPLRYTALGTGCTPLLQCLGWLSLPPSAGR